MTPITDTQRAYLKAMGVDVWVRRDMPEAGATLAADTAVPATAETESAPPEPAMQVSTSAPQAEAPFPDRPTLDWDELEQRVRQCQLCDLHKTRTQAVFGVGNRNADWLIIGEAPGADEDRQGEPFVGRAGQLLNAMLKAIDLDREQVYIANILKCRPPGNRDPRPEEAASCTPYLWRQIELIQPRLILALGRVAAQRLLQSGSNLARLRGRVHQLEATGTPVIVTYHPAYLLRSPGEKGKAWLDLLLARDYVARAGSDGAQG